MPNYRLPVLENFAWQPSVKDRITQAQLEALAAWTKGERYLLTDGANNKKLVYANTSGSGAYVAGNWTYDSPLEGMIVWVDDEDKYYHYTGSVWAEYLGQQGIQGPTGPTGADSTIVGPTGPTSTVVGPTGPTGPTSTVVGPTGPTGADSTIVGPTGPTSTVVGPTGPTGPTNQVYDALLGCLTITL